MNNIDTNLFNIEYCLRSLSEKRPVFHSEADFQFALAWEIQLTYPNANIRFEYSPKDFPNMHIDIIVFLDEYVIPIELKYKTAKLNAIYNSEIYSLKSHGAQDCGKYDCLKDLQRIEEFSLSFEKYLFGYVVWLTNDKSYLNPPSRNNTMACQFSIHQNSEKKGAMNWLSETVTGTMKGRIEAIVLKNKYLVQWKKYSSIDTENGTFFVAVIKI